MAKSNLASKLSQKFKKYLIPSVILYLLSVSTIHQSFSQGILPGKGNDKDWNFVIAPYFWFGALNGVAGVGRVEADIDASFSDIVSNLNMGFMMYGEVRYKKFGLAIDWLTLNMGLKGTRPVTKLPVKIDPKITFLETSLLYSIIHNEKWSMDAHLGIRSWWMKTKMETERIIGEDPIIVEKDLSWVDPIIGVNAVFLPHEKWPVNARFDLGGFGAGSEFTWNLMAGAGYRFAKSWTVLLQYRVMGVDYREGDAGTSDYFKFDANLFGPLVGIMATF